MVETFSGQEMAAKLPVYAQAWELLLAKQDEQASKVEAPHLHQKPLEYIVPVELELLAQKLFAG